MLTKTSLLLLLFLAASASAAEDHHHQCPAPNLDPKPRPHRHGNREYSIYSEAVICVAIKGRNHPVLKVLLDAGANPDVGSMWFGGLFWNTPPLVMAIYNTDAVAVKMLLEAGANPHVNAVGESILFAAIRNAQQIDAINHLLDYNVSPNTMGSLFGTIYTPLGVAAGLGYHDIVRLLLLRGANPKLGLSILFGLVHITPKQIARMVGYDNIVLELQLAEDRRRPLW
jgi:ankyrin repeat protein